MLTYSDFFDGSKNKDVLLSDGFKNMIIIKDSKNHESLEDGVFLDYDYITPAIIKSLSAKKKMKKVKTIV